MKPIINSELLVRSILFLLWMNVKPIQTSIEDEIMMLDQVVAMRLKVNPPAADMHYMTLDPQFTAEAGKLAMNCNFSVPKPGVIYLASPSIISLRQAVITIEEEGKRAIKKGECEENKYHQPCRFYRDLLEAGANRIGCARASCPNGGAHFSWIFYCVTNAKSSNEPFNGLLYKTGAPCQMCPLSFGYCYYNQCISYETKTAILAETPSSVITCDAPCLNCGERKDFNNTCFCQCPTGYNSELDCSKGSGQLTCSACRKAGTPCRNGGREAGSPSSPCRCLCNGGYVGEFCEIPIAQLLGGVVVELWSPLGDILSARTVDKVAEELKMRLAHEINSFCQSSQTNYLLCCGTGNLPTSSPLDFVDANGVHMVRPVNWSDLYTAKATVYVTAKGNNGLCRKRTSSPPPIVPVPLNVVKEVFTNKFKSVSLRCCRRVYIWDIPKSNPSFSSAGKITMNYPVIECWLRAVNRINFSLHGVCELLKIRGKAIRHIAPFPS